MEFVPTNGSKTKLEKICGKEDENAKKNTLKMPSGKID